MKAPRVRGRFEPRRLDGETVWVSDDEAWVVLPRMHLEQYLGRAIERAPDSALETNFGMVMGSGVERPPTLVLHIEGAPSFLPDEGDEVSDRAGSTMAPLDLAVAPDPDEDNAEGPSASTSPNTLWMWALVAVGVGLWMLGAAIMAAIFLRVPMPEAVIVDRGEPERAGEEGALRFLPSAPSDADEGHEPVQPAWEVHIDRGFAVLQDDPVGAEAAFRQAVAMQPRHAEALMGLGAALLAQGMRDEGIDSVCDARRLDRSLEESVSTLLVRYDARCEDR